MVKLDVPGVPGDIVVGLLRLACRKPYGGVVRVAELKARIDLAAPTVAEVVCTVRLLRLADHGEGLLNVSRLGRTLATVDAETRRGIFACQLLKHASLVRGCS